MTNDPNTVAPEAPVSVHTLAAELEEPVGTLVHRLGDDVFIEERTGLRCVTTATCRRLITERREWFARVEADRQQAAQVEREPVSAGVPAVAGLTAAKSLRVAADYMTPSVEFGARPRPNWIDHELAEGQRRLNGQGT